MVYYFESLDRVYMRLINCKLPKNYNSGGSASLQARMTKTYHAQTLAVVSLTEYSLVPLRADTV